MDVEQQVRETYVERLGALELSGGDVGAARRTGARLRARRRLAVGAAAVAVGAVAVGGTLLGTGRVSVGPSHSVGHWRELPTPPLSPRADALSVWTGREVVVVGGDPDPCPPNADCATAPRELRDGAAYDPATDAWHRIAPAPVTVGPGDRLLSAAGRVVLRHWQEHGSRLFVYDPAGDEWSEIPTLLDLFRDHNASLASANQQDGAGNLFAYESGGMMRQHILMANFNTRFSRNVSLFGNYQFNPAYGSLTTDLLGRVRSSTGAWDRGAYETR